MYSFSQLQDVVRTAIHKSAYPAYLPELYDPITYIMNLEGKRLRPCLVLMGCNLFSEEIKTSLDAALAIELFHNFTLMHDDIMDKAPLRRGKMTVHEKWGANTAILSGDVMLIKVYDMFLSLEPALMHAVLRAFNACAAQVCEGQQWDMEFEATDRVSEKQYLEMVRLKTAVLLGFSLELGALLAGAPDSDRKALRDFGTNIGIGFQLKDDLLDAFSDPKKFGKQVGGDIVANKKTYLLIKALENARGSNRRELLYWLGARKFRKTEKVAAVKDVYSKLGIPAIVERKVDQYFRKGFKNLERITGDGDALSTLRDFTRSLGARQS